MLLAKGCGSVTREQINSWEMIEDIVEAKAAIPEIVAKTWLKCQQKGLIPRWAEKQINLDVMNKAGL